jgi:integrase
LIFCNIIIYDVSGSGDDLPKAFLTSAFVRQSLCLPGARRVDYFDESVPGFMLEVRSSGGKTFYQRYRDSRGRERQFKIGSARVLTVRQARIKARSILAGAVLGNDPQKERELLREIPTLAQFARESYMPFAKSAKRSWQTDETVLRIHILPHLGRLALDQVSSHRVAELLHHMREQQYASGTTNRVLVLLRYMFNLAKKWGISGVSNNPAAELKTAPDVCRERFLTAEETHRLLKALDTDENQTAARSIKLLLLTGARRNEITRARWEYIDWQRKTLLVPCSKSGRPRLIQLNSAALELLRSLPREAGNAFIFPSPVTGRPSASLHFPWTRIRKRAGLTEFRLHDLRHSFASFLVNKGVSIYIVQGLLGHANVRATQRYAPLANETLSVAAELIPAVILPTQVLATLPDPPDAA